MGRHTPPDRQRDLVERWRQSDVSIAAFARTHAIHPATFASWIKRHAPARPASSTGHGFVEVTATRGGFTVRVGDHALRFEEPPPTAWFAALLGEMPPC